jgi:hypothetical protein
MRNERERLIEELLARKTETLPPILTVRPGCPPVTDLMDVALGQGVPELVASVKQHSDSCELCRERLAFYSGVTDEEEEDEKVVPDSLLDRLARRVIGPPAPDPEGLNGRLRNWLEQLFECACGLSLDYRCALLDRLTQTPDEVWVPEADALRQRLADTLTDADLEKWREQPESTRRAHRLRAALALRECLLARGAAFRDLPLTGDLLSVLAD